MKICPICKKPPSDPGLIVCPEHHESFIDATEERPKVSEDLDRLTKRRKSSVGSEFAKACLNLFWTWMGFDTLAEDFEHHAGAIRKGRTLAFLCVLMVIAGGSMFLLKGCIDASEIQQQSRTIGDLRYENSTLRTSNSTSEIILDPVRKVARELHPEMETAAAVGKLAEDLRQVRLLATKDFYRPLDVNSRSNLVNALRQIHTKYGTNKIDVAFSVGTSKNMMLLGNECVSILEEAGWNAHVRIGTRVQMPPPPDVEVKFHPEEHNLAEDFAHAMQTLINWPIHISSGQTKERGPPDRRSPAKGALMIEFNAEILFLPNGSVLFK